MIFKIYKVFQKEGPNVKFFHLSLKGCMSNKNSQDSRALEFSRNGLKTFLEGIKILKIFLCKSKDERSKNSKSGKIVAFSNLIEILV